MNNDRFYDSLYRDIFLTNQKNISIAIDGLIRNLVTFKDKIEGNPESLQALLNELKDYKESNY